MSKEMKSRVIAFARLIAVFIFMYGTIANAAGIDVLKIIEVLRYILTHPEALLSAAFATIAWWYNEDVTDRAILRAERNKAIEEDGANASFYENEGDQDD